MNVYDQGVSTALLSFTVSSPIFNLEAKWNCKPVKLAFTFSIFLKDAVLQRIYKRHNHNDILTFLNLISDSMWTSTQESLSSLFRGL